MEIGHVVMHDDEIGLFHAAGVAHHLGDASCVPVRVAQGCDVGVLVTGTSDDERSVHEN
jgi:hypothetical protein